jgi:type IV pilus assembly protein PilB
MVRSVEEHLVRCSSCRQELEGARKLLSWTEAASEKAVIEKVEGIIDDATSAGASDIHLDPQRDGSLSIRQRIDGVLREVESVGSARRYGIVARIKMLAEMNVSESSLPQDGRAKWAAGGKDFDVRVATVPSIYGEGMVVRILDQSSVLIGLDKLGIRDDHLRAIEKLVYQPNGLIIVSGPIGAGKTTTIYSMLDRVNKPEIKLVTVEDPVEYSLKGACQIHINKKAGLTFPVALRAALRWDPDVIYVGEIRDLESLHVSAEAALTGHLVITTVHASDAAGALQRLTDHLASAGVEPFVVGATLIGVIAQRLVRKVCSSCKEEVQIDPSDPKARALGITADDLKDHKVYKGKGCKKCHMTGYRGRTGVYEVLTITKELGALIGEGAAGTEVVEAARREGFVPMQEDGRRKVLDGTTTLEEAFRVLA